MSKVEVFEPALCCATGICGEDVDQRLVRFSADLDFVRSRGGDVSRYNLASAPRVFAENDTVNAAWAGVEAPAPAGSAILDITETAAAGGTCCSDSSGATSYC